MLLDTDDNLFIRLRDFHIDTEMDEHSLGMEGFTVPGVAPVSRSFFFWMWLGVVH